MPKSALVREIFSGVVLHLRQGRLSPLTPWSKVPVLPPPFPFPPFPFLPLPLEVGPLYCG